MNSLKAWFQYPKLLQSFMTDLVIGELTALRPGLPKSVRDVSNTNITFGEHGLGLDSLELMGLSTALARSIHLHESHLEDNLLDKEFLGDWQLIALKSLEIYSARISFKTSGSTGTKKYCTHDLKNIEDEAQLLANLLAGRQRILRAVPSHHIYGFIFSILLPRYLSPDIAIIDVRELSVNALISVMRSGDLVLGFPEFWKYLDESGIEFTADVVGVNSTGPCPEQTGLNLLDRGLSKFYEVYGASETAGIGWRQHPSDAYTLFPFWEKQPQNSELKRVHSPEQLSTVNLQDHLQWFSSNSFIINGRKDDIVQIGGVNVSLHYVCEILKKHPAVKEAVVRMMLPEEGGRLKAFIVLNESFDETHTLKSLNEYSNTVLNAPERPKSIKFGDRLPTNNMGKLCDWSITIDY